MQLAHYGDLRNDINANAQLIITQGIIKKVGQQILRGMEWIEHKTPSMGFDDRQLYALPRTTHPSFRDW